MKKIIHVYCERIAGLITFSILSISFFGWMSCDTKRSENKKAELREFIYDSAYLKQGNHVISITFDTLRNTLVHTIQSQGFENAIAFCNEKAYLLTNTYADSLIIRRTSLRVRNKDNKPDSLELAVLNNMQLLFTTSKVPDVQIVRTSLTEEIHYFKPIILQPMCLNCHGTPGAQIQNSTLAQIQKFYPDDQAINYKEGDLRGVWHIIFKSKK